jgi:hypothetical protein
MASSTTPAARVDLESLLWELRDLLRGLGQVNAAQAAQLASLSALPASQDELNAEYTDRARAALQGIDVALDQLQCDSAASSSVEVAAADEDSNYDDARVRAWLGAIDDSMSASAFLQPVSSSASARPSAPSREPSDFWTTDEDFKWDEEEPEVVSAPTSTLFESAIADDQLTEDDDAVSPWDSISCRDLDLDSEYDSDMESDDESEESQRTPSGSSGDASATLFLSEPIHLAVSKPRIILHPVPLESVSAAPQLVAA